MPSGARTFVRGVAIVASVAGIAAVAGADSPLPTTLSPAGGEPPAQQVTKQVSGAEPPQPEAAPGPNPWALVTAPSDGASAAIGGYSAGCLRGGAVLPLRGRGFRVRNPNRHRHFGHRVLINFLEDFGRRSAAAKAATLSIGDLSMPRGGPTPNGHASHQSGLDVDIAYGSATAANPTASLVDDKRGAVNDRWNSRVLAMLRRAASDPRVSRIFVHPAIKVAACSVTSHLPAEQKTWLRTLRPWWGHDDHFHVRLACPAEDTECVAQPPLPDGDGCGELAWWLDPARAEERAKQKNEYKGRVAARPELPTSCDDVLADAGGPLDQLSNK